MRTEVSAGDRQALSLLPRAYAGATCCDQVTTGWAQAQSRPAVEAMPRIELATGCAELVSRCRQDSGCRRRVGGRGTALQRTMTTSNVRWPAGRRSEGRTRHRLSGQAAERQPPPATECRARPPPSRPVSGPPDWEAHAPPSGGGVGRGVDRWAAASNWPPWLLSLAGAVDDYGLQPAAARTTSSIQPAGRVTAAPQRPHQGAPQGRLVARWGLPSVGKSQQERSRTARI